MYDLEKRRKKERRFRQLGFTAVMVGVLFVGFLFVSIFAKGISAFTQTYLQLEVVFDAGRMGLADDLSQQDLASRDKALRYANYTALLQDALLERFADVSSRQEKRKLFKMVSSAAGYRLRDMVLEDPELIGQRRTLWLLADDEIDMLVKGHIDRSLPESERTLDDQVVGWVTQLQQSGAIERRFNSVFFTSGDSREPEQAGIAGALWGSFYTLLLTLLLAFPIGVATAIYLEEFAPRNRFTDLIEVNINNLAAVPSIIFGLLGLAIFISLFGLPRSTPVVGALVLTLMTLPTVIIASRAAIKSVPPSIRQAALGIGASKNQMVFHHVLPLALPGMLTGSIIGMAQALGETAPLLMIGMVAFIVDVPGGFFDPAAVLPVQIFLWSDIPERAFLEKTAAAIMVLLGFLVSMNLLAVLLRKKFERRW